MTPSNVGNTGEAGVWVGAGLLSPREEKAQRRSVVRADSCLGCSSHVSSSFHRRTAPRLLGKSRWLFNGESREKGLKHSEQCRENELQ